MEAEWHSCEGRLRTVEREDARPGDCAGCSERMDRSGRFAISAHLLAQNRLRAIAEDILLSLAARAPCLRAMLARWSSSRDTTPTGSCCSQRLKATTSLRSLSAMMVSSAPARWGRSCTSRRFAGGLRITGAQCATRKGVCSMWEQERVASASTFRSAVRTSSRSTTPPGQSLYVADAACERRACSPSTRSTNHLARSTRSFSSETTLVCSAPRQRRNNCSAGCTG